MRDLAKILIVFSLVLVSSLVYSQNPGRITGVVVSATDGKPLGFANVVIVGTGMGAFVKENGRFAIENVPPGTYAVKVMMMGYTPQTKENVVVRSNETTELRFELKETVVMEVPVVEVQAERPMVDTEKTQTKRTIDTKEVSVRPIRTVEEAVATQAGVVLDQGEIHVRGGRSGETKWFVDGMQVSDPFVGARSMEVSFASISEVELLTGGFDAEFGNVQSGVVNIRTREGGVRYSGTVFFMTDDYGAPDKTYFNYDNLRVGFGGPLISTNLRFYLSGEFSFEDTYLKTAEERQQKKLWGFIKFRERQQNAASGHVKLTYFFSPTKKLTGSFLGSIRKYDIYNHAMSRLGYWSPEHRHWWFEPLDPTYKFYDAPSHTPDIKDDHREVMLSWNHTLGASATYSLKAGIYTTLHTEAVLGKKPYEYVWYAVNDRLDPENRYYIVAGDYPHWQRYHTRMSNLKGDITLTRGATHQIKFGSEVNTYRLEMEDLLYPSFESPRGYYTDIYKFHCWGMSAFVQDRIRFEGMNLKVGLRFDLFDPGEGAVEAYDSLLAMRGFPPTSTSFLKRAEWQVSPRLGVSYPISERDALYFNYGRFYQIPRLEVLYQFLGQTGQGLLPFGNPLIDAETTIMYEIGVQHQFSRTIVGEVALFYKDIFGLVGTEEGEVKADSPFIYTYGTGATPVVYVNLDYGSVRGVELKLSKRLSHRFSTSIVYTYSKATGSSSNELQGANVVSGAMDRAPITELPLDWDRNHVVTAYLYVTEPGLWGVTIDWSYESGVPFTPRQPREREVRAALINSMRLPSRKTLNIKADKKYRIVGQEVSFFLEGRNILDRKNIRTLNPGSWPGGAGNYDQYYTAQRGLGGAYDVGELLGLPDVIFVPLKDPRVYSEPRNFKVGISFEW